ncbi:metallophosphoesterase [Myxococcaceae bacterium GXIMD 01537]
MAVRTRELITLHVPEQAAQPTKPQGRRMVCWYDPLILAKTGVQAAISATIGKQADRRILDALTMPDVKPEDFSKVDGKPREEMWLDYVSDLGDGWDSTYAIARAVGQKELALRDGKGREYATQAGEVLVFGGDEVYPAASLREYDERTVRPWTAALARQRPAPHLFAVPGNHDWYDGLVSFMRLFCQGRTPAAWVSHQRRSYFAVKLPHGWWLIGTDMQLDSDLDEPQKRYFEGIARHMGPEDRIILCNAEPAWLLAHIRPPGGRTWLDNNLEFLQEEIFGKRISVFLSGDLHNYRRHANEEGRQKIVAGGGGAFLHPTHAPKLPPELPGGFTQRESFPVADESRRLCWRNLAFLKHNLRFGFLMGGLYTVLSWALSVDMGALGVPVTPGLMLRSALLDPAVLIMSVLLVLGTIGFADRRFGKARWVAGLLHGVAHLVAAFVIAWIAAWFTGSVLGMDFRSGARDLVSAVVVFAGGFLVGPTLMGLYLLISLNRFGAHPNEAFSSLAIEDWKNFLRLKIDRDGRLWIFPVGIQRVPRTWKAGETVRDPQWVAADKDATPPRLIESPIVIGAPPATGEKARDLTEAGGVYAGAAPP